MKILKFLSGGTPMFLPITDPFKAPKDSTAASSSSKKDSSLISDDLVKKLYDHGIPTDVDNFLDKVADLEYDQSLGLPVSARSVRKLEALGNRIIQLSKYLKSAEEAAAKNDALGEIAVGSRGELFIADKEKGIKKVSVGEFDPTKMAALTVGEIIEARKFSPSQAFNEDIIPVAGRNIGLSKIAEYIQNVIKTVGTTSSTTEAYTDLAGYIGKEVAKKPSEIQLQQLQSLVKIMDQVGGNAIFKSKDIMSSKNMDIALDYIESVLPIDMKRQLISRSVASGNTYLQGYQNIKTLIAQAMGASNDKNELHHINYDSGINKIVGTDAGKKESSKTFYQTPNEAFFDGDLNLTEILLTDPSGYNKYGAVLKGSLMPALTTDNGNAVSNLPMSYAINETIGKYMDKNYMYMGEQKLNGEAELANIAYASDQVAKVYIPCTEDGAIDWTGFHRYGAAEDEIKRRGITDPNQKNQIHAEMGSYVRYGQDGNVMPNSHVQEYLMTYGYTIDDHIADDNMMVTELKGKEEDAADELLNSIYNKNFAKKTGYKNLPNRQIWDDIYKVPVFIKINKFASGDAYRYGGHGSSMTPLTLEQDMIKQKIQQEPEIKITGSSSLLYGEENE